MKKILSISVIAAMAALPMAANASYTGVAINTTESPTDAEIMATASYVKGAYNSLRAEKQDKLSETQMAAVDSGITAAKLTALESAMGASGKSVAEQIKEGAEGADFTADQGAGFTAGTDTINEALNDLDSRKQDKASSTVADRSGVTNNHLTAGNGVAGNLVALDNALIAETTARTNADTALDGRVEALENALDGTSTTSIATTYATKAGVDATLATVAQGTVTNGAISGEISTTGGSFTYVTDWSTGATDTVSFLTAANKGTIASNVSVAAPTFSTYAAANTTTPAQGD